MPAKIAKECRNAYLDSIIARAGNGAKLTLYSGVQPSNGNGAVGSSVILSVHTCGTPFASAAASGAIISNPIGAATAVGGGAGGLDATWARLMNSAQTVWVADLTVTEFDGGGDIQMDVVLVKTGGTVTPGNINITAGNPAGGSN